MTEEEELAALKAQLEPEIVKRLVETLYDERDAARAQVAEAVEALDVLRSAALGFADSVRLHTNTAFPWPALDIAVERIDALIDRHRQQAAGQDGAG